MPSSAHLERQKEFELEPRPHGKDGRVIVPVIGALGEMSSDVYAIIDLVGTMLSHKHLLHYSKHPSAINSNSN